MTPIGAILGLLLAVVPRLEAAILTPPVGSRHVFLTPPGQAKVSQSATTVLRAERTAAAIRGVLTNLNDQVMAFVLGVCVNEGFCDGTYVKLHTNGTGAQGNPACNWSPGCNGSAASGTIECFTGMYCRYPNVGPGREVFIRVWDTDCPSYFQDDHFGSTVGDILGRWQVWSYCTAPGNNTMIGIKNENFSWDWRAEVEEITQVPPAAVAENAARQHTHQVYNYIVDALVVISTPVPGGGGHGPHLPPAGGGGGNAGDPSQITLLNAALKILSEGTPLVKDVDYIEVKDSTRPYTPTGTKGDPVVISGDGPDGEVFVKFAPNERDGSETKPFHVIVDNEVTVKLKDGATVSGSSWTARTRGKTFAEEYNRVVSQSTIPPVVALLDGFVLPVSSTTFSTEFCFDMWHFGNHCMDLRDHGYTQFAALIRWFVIASAFVFAYQLIFG